MKRRNQLNAEALQLDKWLIRRAHELLDPVRNKQGGISFQDHPLEAHTAAELNKLVWHSDEQRDRLRGYVIPSAGY